MPGQKRCAICLRDWIPGSSLSVLDTCSHISHTNCCLTTSDCFLCKKEPNGASLILSVPNIVILTIGVLLEDPDLVHFIKTCKYVHNVFNTADSEEFWEKRCYEVPRLYFGILESVWVIPGTWKEKYERLDYIPKAATVDCENETWGHPCCGPHRYYYTFELREDDTSEEIDVDSYERYDLKRVWYKKPPPGSKCVGHPFRYPALWHNFTECNMTSCKINLG